VALDCWLLLLRVAIGEYGSLTDVGRDSFVFMPYFARVEYKERIVCDLFGGGCSTSEGPTALSRLWKASSNFRYNGRRCEDASTTLSTDIL